MNILITTLGYSWQIVPELIGFTNPMLVDLYRHHPDAADFERERKRYGLLPADEVYLVTTEGGNNAIEKVLAWGELMGKGCPKIRIWQVQGVEDLSSRQECEKMAECIFRVFRLAANIAHDGGVTVSLTGGRKTMSSDIQYAASFFGCRAMLHVIQNQAFADRYNRLGMEDFTRPLSADLIAGVTPLVAGDYRPSPLAGKILASKGDADGDFSMALPEPQRPCRVNFNSASLVSFVNSLVKRAGFLFENYSEKLKGERISNFLCLYGLPSEVIRRLKKERIGNDRHKAAEELSWLKRLPKAELHCHLGGVADVEELIGIAASERNRVERFFPKIRGWLKETRSRALAGGSGFNLREELLDPLKDVPRPLCAAAFLLSFENDPASLERIIYRHIPEKRLFCKTGFDAYERIGDVQGSILLQSEATIRAAVKVLLQKYIEHNVKYLEIRCSPANYIHGGLSPEDVASIIDEEIANERIETSIIFIASRHGRIEKVEENVELAEKLLDRGLSRIRGFDVAGNEKSRRAAQMRDALMRMMQRCLHFTIHAGETEDVSSIWEAVYHLNAERIGHGLTLQENPELMERFRERKIALEMCPSSNFQIVGFRDKFMQETSGLGEYPLKKYLDSGLRVTVNTDNPGISRTTPSDELYKAARMTRGGLSLWEILILIRNGFKAAFIDTEKKQNMIIDAEERILEILVENEEK